MMGNIQYCYKVATKGGNMCQENICKKNTQISFVTEHALLQGIDGSARKPALRKDTGYMVEKTYTDIAPYLGAFGA